MFSTFKCSNFLNMVFAKYLLSEFTHIFNKIGLTRYFFIFSIISSGYGSYMSFDIPWTNSYNKYVIKCQYLSF